MADVTSPAFVSLQAHIVDYFTVTDVFFKGLKFQHVRVSSTVAGRSHASVNLSTVIKPQVIILSYYSTAQIIFNALNIFISIGSLFICVPDYIPHFR